METTGRLRLDVTQARRLVNEFGTPLYVVDEATFRNRIRRYRDAMASTWPKTHLAYASKANNALAINRIAFLEGCLIDASSEGEIEAALRAGVPPSSINMHGCAKSDRELDYAIQTGIRQIIIDNHDEIDRLITRSQALRSSPTRAILRLAPGVDPITHERIATGQEDSKFGMNLADGSAEKGLAMCLEAGLPVDGFHAHVGSQLLDPNAQIASAERLAQFAVSMREKFEFVVKELNLGGGLGAHYTQKDEPLAIEDYVERVNSAAGAILRESNLEPTLIHEPGRALICEAGVTLYRLEVAKEVSLGPDSKRMYLMVDGGLADNPRPAVYDATYEVEILPAEEPRPGADGTIVATISGRHCETDALFKNVEVSAGARIGDLVQVFSTGAYNASMASQYNRYVRPPMVLIRESREVDVIQEPENFDEMFARERIPNDL